MYCVHSIHCQTRPKGDKGAMLLPAAAQKAVSASFPALGAWHLVSRPLVPPKIGRRLARKRDGLAHCRRSWETSCDVTSFVLPQALMLPPPRVDTNAAHGGRTH